MPGKRIARSLLAVLFLPAGLLTLALFLGTSGPIPSDFRPWGPEWPDAAYVRLDDSGRVWACPGDQIVALHSIVPSDQPGLFELNGLNKEIDFSKAILRHWMWGSEVSMINAFGGIAAFKRLSANEGVTAQYDGTSITFYSWPAQPILCKIERDGIPMQFYSWPAQARRGRINLDRECWELAISHDGQRVITLEAGSQIKVWDIASGTAISVWKPTGEMNPIQFYFDANDQPKLVWAGGDQGYTKSDIFTKKQEISLDESITGTIMHSSGASAIDAGLSKFACPNGISDVGVWSLDDGRLQYQYSWPNHELIESHFAPTGRFLACAWVGESNCQRLLKKNLGGALFDKIEATSFYETVRPLIGYNVSTFSVHDLMSGETWRGWEDPQAVLFSNDGTKLYSFHEDGRYTWDLPPRWRWFTPWAWVSLAGWIGIGWGWKRVGLWGRKSGRAI